MTQNGLRAALSLALREAPSKGAIFEKGFLTDHAKVSYRDFEAGLKLLVELNVLREISQQREPNYALRPKDEGGPKEFLILDAWKRVTVSELGNRAVRVQTEAMAVRDEVSFRPCGSVMWSDNVSAPKFRLGPASRVDPLNVTTPLKPCLETVKKDNTHIAFKLVFDPPLHAGEIITYGFYTWTGNYYAMTKEECKTRYNDEWSREGFSVGDPSLSLRINVNLPDGFEYQEAVLEKDPVLTPNGPNIPGSVVSSFAPRLTVLRADIEKPSAGHYFVSWRPPEKAKLFHCNRENGTLTPKT